MIQINYGMYGWVSRYCWVLGYVPSRNAWARQSRHTTPHTMSHLHRAWHRFPFGLVNAIILCFSCIFWIFIADWFLCTLVFLLAWWNYHWCLHEAHTAVWVESWLRRRYVLRDVADLPLGTGNQLHSHWYLVLSIWCSSLLASRAFAYAYDWLLDFSRAG